MLLLRIKSVINYYSKIVVKMFYIIFDRNLYLKIFRKIY